MGVLGARKPGEGTSADSETLRSSVDLLVSRVPADNNQTVLSFLKKKSLDELAQQIKAAKPNNMRSNLRTHIAEAN